MDLDHINRMLAELPSYAEVLVETSFGLSHLMARDLPRADRRLTNLTSGVEWFLPLREARAVTVLPYRVEVWP